MFISKFDLGLSIVNEKGERSASVTCDHDNFVLFVGMRFAGKVLDWGTHRTDAGYTGRWVTLLGVRFSVDFFDRGDLGADKWQ